MLLVGAPSTKYTGRHVRKRQSRNTLRVPAFPSARFSRVYNGRNKRAVVYASVRARRAINELVKSERYRDDGRRSYRQDTRGRPRDSPMCLPLRVTETIRPAPAPIPGSVIFRGRGRAPVPPAIKRIARRTQLRRRIRRRPDGSADPGLTREGPDPVHSYATPPAVRSNCPRLVAGNPQRKKRNNHRIQPCASRTASTGRRSAAPRDAHGSDGRYAIRIN